MPLIKLVENVDVSFASATYTVAEDGTVESSSRWARISGAT